MVQPRYPSLSAFNEAEEPWRLARLARVDGRVREILRMLTREPATETSSLGELIWTRHVSALHDERGVLLASVGLALIDSPWLAVLAAVLARAWDGEDEAEAVFIFPDGQQVTLQEMLPLPDEDTEDHRPLRPGP